MRYVKVLHLSALDTALQGILGTYQGFHACANIGMGFSETLSLVEVSDNLPRPEIFGIYDSLLLDPFVPKK